MRPTTKKIMGVMLSGLAIAGYVLPVVQAQNTEIGKTNMILQNSPDQYKLVGFILLHWEFIIDMVYIYGFRTILVFCITYQEGNMTGVGVLGPSHYFDLREYRCTGHIGQFVINAELTQL